VAKDAALSSAGGAVKVYVSIVNQSKTWSNASGPTGLASQQPDPTSARTRKICQSSAAQVLQLAQPTFFHLQFAPVWLTPARR